MSQKKNTRMLKYLLLLNLTFASCASIAGNKAPSPAAPQTAKTHAVRTQQADDPAASNLLTIGETEHLYVHDAEYAYDARIDTGATTCSIHAEDIQPFERDGEQWVKFKLVNFSTKERIERSEKVTRVVDIKRHGSDSVTRHAVNLKVQLAEDTRIIEFTLTDRSNYRYPLLVGRNLLRGIAVVDVSQSYTLKQPTKKSIAERQAK